MSKGNWDNSMDAVTALLDTPKEELIESLVNASQMISRYQTHDLKSEALLEETRNMADQFSRRMTLIAAIADTSERALSLGKLDAIAEIVWPPIVEKHVTDITQQPTQLPARELLQASKLLRVANGFLKVMFDTYSKIPGWNAGTDLIDQMQKWRAEVHAWRTHFGIEQQETDEANTMPQ